MQKKSISRELDLAASGGYIHPDDRTALQQEALALGKSPLLLLLEKGLISAETMRGLSSEDGLVGRSLLATIQPLADSGGKLPSNPDFPVPNWDRYHWERLLGQGGMGRVFLAYDPRLERRIAIKFMRGEQPGVASRLIREARAQAKVKHDRVCQVYEVEEIGGRVYIAMQYIDGHSLAELPHLSLHEKVRLIKEVAEGVHAAHEAGLIHRDIKPANIMVAQAAGKPYQPYIMDFGLAYAHEEEGTQTHGVGTPHFMAPEQALGKENLDPRCDVYALGASLYWMLTGSPPVAGSNNLDIIARIPNEEPAKPWSLDKSIPRDIGLILLKCLEKEPGQRYGSAAAFAEDLDRFCRGEAVIARDTDYWYQLRKALLGNKVALSIAVTALLLVSIFLFSIWRMRQTTILREGFIRDFTQQAEEVEAMARYTYMMPIHDIRRERMQLAAKVARIETVMERSGAAANDAGLYALGRGMLVLDRPAEAQRYLESAWRNGFTDPRVAFSLAQVLGDRYREGIAEASVIVQRTSRDAHLRETTSLYREPAMHFLAKVPREGSRLPNYLTALVAYFEERYQPALAALAEVHFQAPWFYEAHLLEGDIYQAQAQVSMDLGHREDAILLFEKGSDAYRKAAQLAPSQPKVYLSWANLKKTMVRMALYGDGELETPYQEGLALLEKTLQVMPDSLDALYQRAFLKSFYAEFQQNTGGESNPLLDAAIKDARQILKHDPQFQKGFRLLGHLFNQRAAGAEGKNQDPRPFLAAAMNAFDRVPATARDANYYLDLGNTHSMGARYELARGLDSEAKQLLGIEAFRHAIALNPRSTGPYVTLGTLLFDRASRMRGEASIISLEEAADTFTACLKFNADHMVAFYYLGQCYRKLGVALQAKGGDPRGYFEGAINCQQRAAAINGKYPHFPQAESIVWYDLSKYYWQTGLEWETALVTAEACVQRSLAADPNFGYAYLQLGLIQLQWMRNLNSLDKDLAPQLTAALTAFDRAGTLLPNLYVVYDNRAMVHYIAGLSDFNKGRSPMPRLEKATLALDKAFSLNPHGGELHFDLAHIQTLKALWLARLGLDPEAAFQEAACTYQTALEQDPNNSVYLLAFAKHLHQHAIWLAGKKRPFNVVVRQGLALLERNLDHYANNAEAMVLQIALKILWYDTITNRSTVENLYKAAHDRLDKIFASSAYLKYYWKNLTQAAKVR